MGNSFENDIVRITGEVMSDGTVEQIMREKITEGFKAAVESSFSYGDLNRAISARVKEVLVPFIEEYDMGGYVVKLDEVLSQVIEGTALAENAKILKNFKTLMADPPEKTVTLEELFGKYCEHVAKEADTSRLEVVTDEEPEYEPVTVHAEITETEMPRWSSAGDVSFSLCFGAEGQDGLGYTVCLRRWGWDKEAGAPIRFDADPRISRLRYMDGFAVLLCSLSRAGVRLTWDGMELGAEVTPDATPEPTY